MAQEKPNPIVEWFHAVRERAPLLREQFGDWISAAREEPALIWQTVAVRYAAYGAAGLVSLWLVSFLPSMIGPPPPANSRPAAESADFHVVCSEPECGRHVVIHRKFGFQGFPVECPTCKKATGAQARQCNSSTCGGRWVAPAREDSGWRCPACGRVLP